MHGRGGRELVRERREICACEANTPLLGELRDLEVECSRLGKQNLRCVERNTRGHGGKLSRIWRVSNRRNLPNKIDCARVLRRKNLFLCVVSFGD